MLVVVPTETGSYRSPTFFTFGAVWRHTAPRRSTGGSFPSSKMRIIVRSLTPKTTPSRLTVSPALSSRTSSSASGVLNRCAAIGRPLPSLFDPTVGIDPGRRAFPAPALQSHGHRILGDMGMGVLDLHPERRSIAAQTHGPDARRVDGLQKLALQGGDRLLRVRRADRPPDSLLRELHRQVSSAAESDSYQRRWARFATGLDDTLEHESLDAGQPVGWRQHREERHVFRAGPLGHHFQLDVSGLLQELDVDHGNALTGVGLRIRASDRMAYRRPQRMLSRRPLHTVGDRRQKQRAIVVDTAPDPDLVHGRAGVLADQELASLRDVQVLQ